MPTDRAGRIGVLLAAIGAMSYGVTVVVGEDLADAGLGPTTSLGVRFAVGGLILAIVLRLGAHPCSPLGERCSSGSPSGRYAAEATFFFSALERGTAAAAALVFYVYPAMVTVIELLRGRERPHRTTFVALGLSTVGAAIVVVGGGEVSITAAGVVFALGAAATFSAYLLVGREYSESVDPMTMACWVSIGASLSNLARGALSGQLVNPSSRALEIVLYGARHRRRVHVDVRGHESHRRRSSRGGDDARGGGVGRDGRGVPRRERDGAAGPRRCCRPRRRRRDRPLATIHYCNSRRASRRDVISSPITPIAGR